MLDRATGKELPVKPPMESRQRKTVGRIRTQKTIRIVRKFVFRIRCRKDGEFRIRILKTYKDPKSYYTNSSDAIVFDRSLGIKRNIVILPAGFELVGCSVPAMVDIQNGRVRVSMVNDRDDELQVKITGRKLPVKEVKFRKGDKGS